MARVRAVNELPCGRLEFSDAGGAWESKEVTRVPIDQSISEGSGRQQIRCSRGAAVQRRLAAPGRLRSAALVSLPNRFELKPPHRQHRGLEALRFEPSLCQKKLQTRYNFPGREHRSVTRECAPDPAPP